MPLAGVLPFTTIDFPGKFAAGLFFRGCNLRCPYCHNAGIASGKTESTYAIEDAARFLNERKGKLDGVVLSGGEPTLDLQELKDVVSIIPEEYAIKLDTNGTVRPLEEVIEAIPRISYIAMDYKAPIGHLHWFMTDREVLCFRHNLEYLAAFAGSKELRTTIHRSLLSPDDIEDMYHGIRYKRIPWFLQQYHTAQCFNASLNEAEPYSDEILQNMAAKYGCKLRGVNK